MVKILVCFTLAALAVCLATSLPVTAYDRPERKPAIVLAAFGTTDVAAVHSIMNILARVETAFPAYDVHLAFTSNIIRNIWHKRAADAEFRRENPDIPETVYAVKSSIGTLAEIQERGARLVLVQSLHVTDGEEYTDLVGLVKALGEYNTMKPALKPFPWIGVGEPALGVGDGQPAYLDRAAKAMEPLARMAKESGAALVLMGHGNEHLNQMVFARLESALRNMYGPRIYIGTVEAPPFAEDIVEAMEKDAAPKKALLAPLMVVAGDHARNDMAGDDDDSWVSVFKANGFETETYLVGLGSNDSWADIYIEHLKTLESVVTAKKAADEAGDE